MKTYKEHYEYCRSIYDYSSSTPPKYKSAYDLRVDNNFLAEITNKKYFELIDSIRKSLDSKIVDPKPYNGQTPYPDCFIDSIGHAIRIHNWFDIPEIKELTQMIMPVVERDILGCNGKVEFLHPYRNIPSNKHEESSWRWHYDDCPNEFLKLFINLNQVTENSGPLKYLQLASGEIPIIETYNTVAGIRSTGNPVYPSSRVPQEVVDAEITRGGKIISVTGNPGSYAICTPNICHKASIPSKETVPRDVLFFFIRPSIKKYDNYLEDTHSYFPAKNVKMYNLD
jgi:hypothetical protein